MMNFKVLTAVGAVAGIAGLGTTALADPYADDVVSINRVMQGTTLSGYPLTVNSDDAGVDNGVDATGKSDYVPNDFRQMTALGFDEMSGDGGVLELAFTDNLCLDGFGDQYGNDVLIKDAADNEGALIEVSDDGGRTYVPLGVAGPSNSFKVGLDATDQIDFFNFVRITATDWAGNRSAAGIDLESVKCLTSMPEEEFAAVRDQCEFSKGDSGLDVVNAVVYSEIGEIRVTLDMCDVVPNKKGPAIFRTYLDYRDQSNNDGDGVDDGPDTLDANPDCVNTADHVASYEDRTSTGGTYTIDGDRVTLDISYADLGAGPGDEILMWIETKTRGNIGDSVPTQETGDKCDMPQTSNEVMRFVLR